MLCTISSGEQTTSSGEQTRSHVSCAVDVESIAEEQDASIPEAANSEFVDAEAADAEFIEWWGNCRIQGGMS